MGTNWCEVKIWETLEQKLLGVAIDSDLSFKSFSANVSLQYPLKTLEKRRFLMFSGSVKMKHGLKMV